MNEVMHTIFSTDYHYWQNTDVLFLQPFTHKFFTYLFKMYFYK